MMLRAWKGFLGPQGPAELMVVLQSKAEEKSVGQDWGVSIAGLEWGWEWDGSGDTWNK